ncbi:hypothetical protein GGR52DRAFT_324537 [Hypoxylon sp. FL1284]|nr:hypothetical protein GGR52DRAFT_324537 [Hypoxylon sp. FL1284]
MPNFDIYYVHIYCCCCYGIHEFLRGTFGELYCSACGHNQCYTCDPGPLPYSVSPEIPEIPDSLVSLESLTSVDSFYELSQDLHSHDNNEHVGPVHTAVADHQDTEIESYIPILVEDIFNKVEARELDDQTIERLSTILPGLLGAVAHHTVHEASSQNSGDIKDWVIKHRDAIATEFISNYDQKRGSKSRERSTENQSLTDTPEPEEYKELIFGDSSYTWLLDRLRVEIACSQAKLDTSRNIREVLLRMTPLSSRVVVVYRVDWPILAFFQSQNYGIPNAEAFPNVITLTGTQTDAQALSCRQYIMKIWPSTGVHTLQLIQDMLGADGRKTTLAFETPSRLALEACIDGVSVVVRVTGNSVFVGEIGEQLAWLGAALRPSPVDIGITLCTPSLDKTTLLDQTAYNEPIDATCTINYNLEVSKTSPDRVDGRCWHHLFANPVVAHGFPISRRFESDTGLEAPLDMLVSLARARYIDTFKSKVFIKGFSTMLVPTRQLKDVVVWHLLYSNSPEERISYLDCDLEHADVQVAHLGQYRHILGWCSNATSIIGTNQAPLNVGPSGLPIAHSRCALEKAEISAGQIVTGTLAFTLGNKEKSPHIPISGYCDKLQTISSRYFLFWDEGEKKGWLVDGASALLHMLRASLEYSRRTLNSTWLLASDAMCDKTGPTQAMSALETLINQDNRGLRLYIEKTEVIEEETNDGASSSRVLKRQRRYYLLEDRIEDIYNILEKLIDHQTDAERRPGLQISIQPRRQLEGWDFKDLVAGNKRFLPRVAVLKTIGKGWVDFTRMIHAVTIFGQGFGELIKPRSNTSCRWSVLPSQRYYLAALVSDIRSIMKDHGGDPTSVPRRLCDNILWHMKEGTFRPCPCLSGVGNKCHDPVQALFPWRFLSKLAQKSHVALEDQGAVIFGQNKSIKWHWRDVGDPVRGDPPPQLDLPLDTFDDSGLGSGIGSSRSPSTSDPNSVLAMGS